MEPQDQPSAIATSLSDSLAPAYLFADASMWHTSSSLLKCKQSCLFELTYLAPFWRADPEAKNGVMVGHHVTLTKEGCPFRIPALAVVVKENVAEIFF